MIGVPQVSVALKMRQAEHKQAERLKTGRLRDTETQTYREKQVNITKGKQIVRESI